MAKYLVREDVTPKYMAAAKRMLERLGIDAGGLKSPGDVREALFGSLKDPYAKETINSEVLFDGNARRFIIHEDGSVTILRRKGEAYLFLGEDYAVFAELKTKSKEAHFVFYCGKEGIVEMDADEGTCAREAGGKREVVKILEEDYAAARDETGGNLAEWWLPAVAVINRRVSEMSLDAALIATLAGKRK
jgi:hypothetical protein